MPVEITAQKVIDLAAADTIFFGQTFFPRTFRQASPEFHVELLSDLDNRSAHKIAFVVFREGAKTSLLRVFTAKRIAYDISRTIVYIGVSQAHAIRSVRWLKGQITRNKKFTSTFGLRKGSKWTDEEIEIVSDITGQTATVLAMGITGSIRGINVEDYRPDLIIVDDPLDDQNTLTEEQREKTERFIHGAIVRSLVPTTENPDAKLVILQTPQDRADAVMKLEGDPAWRFRKYSVFDGNGESRWPERFPTEQLLRDKESYIFKNLLGTWLREMECKITDPSKAAFRREWLKFYEDLPEKMVVIGAIDPVPPPKEGHQGKLTTDFEVLRIVGYSQGNFYILEGTKYRGHTPERTISEFFRLNDKWRPFKWRVETVAYQRTLAWLLRRAMDTQGRYVQLDEIQDKRKKGYRIYQALHGIASNGKLFVSRFDAGFIEDFCTFPDCQYFDDLDATAMALDGLLNEPNMIQMLEAADLASGNLGNKPNIMQAP